MSAWWLRESDLSAFLSRGLFRERFITTRDQAGLRYARPTDATLTAIDIRSARAPASAKPFGLPARQIVARYPEHVGVGKAPPLTECWLVAGLRACELRAFRYLDRVFSTPPLADPVYMEFRAARLLVSADCVQPHETCFCNLVNGAPYATEGSDINLTPISGGYVVEAFSDAGRAYVEQARDCLTAASEPQFAEREQARRGAAERLQAANAEYRPRQAPDEALAARENDAAWDGLAARCVECGACTQICPTCHCFYLLDRVGGPGATAAEEPSSAAVFERLRAWDSCVWSGYSRMAGAEGMKPNPRGRFRTRFANRFLHKYVWSLQQWQMLGCVGCGRCTEACAGRIDMRAVVRELSA